MLIKPREKNNHFKEFNSELYTTKSWATNEDFVDFFDYLNLPKLDETSRSDLDSNFSESQLVEAIKAFPFGTEAGTDGCEFYKAFHKTLAPLLLRMINDSINNNRFPKSL